MEFSDIKTGDTIRITIGAHTARRLSGKTAEVPAKTITARVNAIMQVNGQPGRQQAACSVLVTAEGEDLSNVDPRQLPNFTVYSTNPVATQSFERA